ncbi:hypothetical protein DFH08DRAFT_796780 [Mycena albidolilacea]|uniref:Uncharacterized protein n=1 Tax=Mycena albidolilacea TaxID=1033008 RepID=A0AAD7AVV1_9AGAR|nr:hypothetical protein DFH08DRAFT_796780 [Mycena albidolilacea]
MLRSETARNFLHSGGVRTATSESIFQLSAVARAGNIYRAPRDSAHLTGFEKRRALSCAEFVAQTLRVRPKRQRSQTSKAGMRRAAARGGNWRYRPKEGDLNFVFVWQSCESRSRWTHIAALSKAHHARGLLARTISGQEGRYYLNYAGVVETRNEKMAPKLKQQFTGFRLGFLVSVGKAHYLQPKTLKGGNRDNGGIWRYLIYVLVLFHGDRRVRRYQTDCQAEGRMCALHVDLLEACEHRSSPISACVDRFRDCAHRRNSAMSLIHVLKHGPAESSCIGPGDEPVKRVKKCAGTELSTPTQHWKEQETRTAPYRRSIGGETGPLRSAYVLIPMLRSSVTARASLVRRCFVRVTIKKQHRWFPFSSRAPGQSGIRKEMRREWLQIGRRHWQPGRPTNERARPRVQASSTVLNEEPRKKSKPEGEKWHMFSSSRHRRKCARDKCASPHPRTVTTVTMWGRRSRFQVDGGTGPIPHSRYSPSRQGCHRDKLNRFSMAIRLSSGPDAHSQYPIAFAQSQHAIARHAGVTTPLTAASRAR